MVIFGYATDFVSTLFFLHDHPFYFTTANALMAGGHNHTVSTLTPTIIIYVVVYFLEHATIIFNSHACKILPVSAAESLSPELSSFASI